MHRRMLAALAIAALAGWIGCGGARPSRYYMLELPALPPAAADNPYPITLLVGHISAPDLLRDDHLVYRTGPGQLGAYEYQRWAERPTEMLEAMLVRELRASGRYRTVERWGSNAQGDYLLRGRLLRLEEVDSGKSITANVELDLELFHPKTSETVWYESYSHDEPVSGKTVPAVVEAMNRNVQHGLEQLAASLERYFAAHRQK